MKPRSWLDFAEITASPAVIATLAILIVQINESNEIEKAQSALRRAQWDSQMFLMSGKLPDILSKIKAVDGNDLQLMMDHYDLTYAEAATWNRWLTFMWRGVEADYLLPGQMSRLNNSFL